MTNQAIIEAAIEAVAERLIDEIHTAIPATVESVNPDGTINATPEIIQKDDNGDLLEIPTIYNIPVIETRVGALMIEAPIKKGEKALIIFSEADIDGWVTNRTKSVADDPRRFSITDGIAILGLGKKARKPATKKRIIDEDTGMNIEFTADRININNGALEILK